MTIEKDRGCLDGLLLAPVDRSAIYFGKLTGNLVFMLIVEIIVIPVFSILYNINLFHPALLLVFFLGSLGYIAVGTLLSTMSIQARTREILLPILLFPVIVPVLVAAVKATLMVLQGSALGDISIWMNILCAYDVIFLAIGWLVFDYIVQE
jgi:heme exporter protein B